ncbi:MAG: alpha-E domain-containing protein [Saprospiraceae bacterium]|nr:alpha-E domain-containing protein [Saprospiraceae bacterium]
MLSRVADSMFWMARYIERTNGMMRLLRTSYISSQDEVKDFSWRPILNHYSDHPGTKVFEYTSSTEVLDHLLLDKENTASVLNNITRARENARAVQDHITKEVWQCLNEFYHLIRNESTQYQVRHGDTLSALDTLITQGWLYHGIVDITMARGDGFAFLSLGKFIERVNISTNSLMIKLAELNYKLDQRIEIPALRYLLYSLSGYELYLKTHRENLKADLVIQLILYNPNFPHSISYGLTRISRYLQKLQPESLPEGYQQLDFLTGKLINQLKYTSIDIYKGNSLQLLLEEIRKGLYDITAALNQNYFGNS